MVIDHGEIVFERAYGVADMESGRMLTPDTPVRLASVSKAFFTMGVMILAEEGHLDYDDPVTNWLPELERFEGVTVRHLMTHTSGLPDYWGDDLLYHANPQLDSDSLITNDEAAHYFRTSGEFVFQPGDRYEYSNSAYEMIALIIERISEMSAREFLKERIFTPLGMSTADVRDRRDYRIKNSAIGYSSPRRNQWEENDDHWGNGLVGAGAVYASIMDMYAWDQALYSGGAVSMETLNEAFTPHSLNDGSISEYGFGWGTRDIHGRTAISHSGGWVGFSTKIDRFVEDEVTVIVLSNAQAPSGLLAAQISHFYISLTD